MPENLQLPPELVGGFAAVILGLVLGSFATAVSWRLPRGITIVWGGSRCPSCSATLRVRDLVPVLSWLFAGRRCTQCGVPISPRYPATELLMAAMFLGAEMQLGMTWPALVLAALAVGLVIITLIDLEFGIIPDLVLILIAPLGPIYLLLLGAKPMDLLTFSLVGAVAGSGAFLLVREGFKRFAGKDALGLGDVKFVAVVGLWLGAASLPNFMVLSGVLGGVFGILWRRAGGAEAFPFGPALAAALYLCLLFPAITRWSF